MTGGHFSNAQLSALRFRIIYDTLSKYSCSINKCNSLDEVFQVLRTDLKYLFDFVAVKFQMQDADSSSTFFIPRNQSVDALFQPIVAQGIYAFEQEAAERQIVQYFDRDTGSENFLDVIGDTELLHVIDAVWAFPFKIKNATLVATIFASQQYAFKRTDVPVLRIVCESLFSKILSLRLLEEVTESRNFLNEANIQLDARNQQIEQLTRTQEQTIQDRTDELVVKNAKLVDLIQFNAHNIREPLSRILGLADLIGLFPPEEIKEELVPALLLSCTDLDEAIKSMIAHIEAPSSNIQIPSL